MSTPSSGTICWSQIQSVSGGSYCMSNFNAVSGRGYCASNYYSYSPPATCLAYQCYDYGWVEYIDCYGYYQYYYVNPYDGFCVNNFLGGPAYWTGSYCEF